MRSKNQPMVYDLTFPSDEAGDLSKKVLIPLDDETPRELQFMELAHEAGFDPLSYRARLLQPEEAKDVIKQVMREERKDRIMQSMQGQLFERLNIEIVDDFRTIGKLQERAAS
jgi:hypothetical protein